MRNHAGFMTYLARVVEGQNVVIPGVAGSKPLRFEAPEDSPFGLPKVGARVKVWANHDFTQIYYSEGQILGDVYIEGDITHTGDTSITGDITHTGDTSITGQFVITHEEVTLDRTTGSIVVGDATLAGTLGIDDTSIQRRSFANNPGTLEINPLGGRINFGDGATYDENGFDEFKAGGFNITNTSTSLPGFSADYDSDTGLALPGGDIVSLTTGGTTRLDLTTTAANFTVDIDTTGAVTADSVTADTNVISDYFTSLTGDFVAVTAGESYGQALGNLSAELVYLVAEGGIKFVESSDDWATGWAGRIESQISDGRAQMADGSVGIPAFSFIDDNDTGMWRIAENVIGLGTGGVERVRIGAGTAASPALVISGDNNNSGFYRFDVNDIGIALNGKQAAAFMGGPGVDERLRLFHNNANEGCYISFYEDANATPSRIGYIGFAGTDDLYINNEDADGVVYIQGDQVVFQTDVGGITEAARFDTSHDLDMQNHKIYDVDRVQVNNGSASAPTFTFDSDTNTGVYGTGTGGEVRISGDSLASTFHRTAAGANGSVLLYQNAHSGTLWDNAGSQAGLRIYSGRDTGVEGSSGLSGWMCQTTFGTDRHVHARVFHTTGDSMTYRNYENTAWVSLQASAFTISSSQKNKSRVRTGREETHPLLDGFAVPGNRNTAFQQVRALRPVIFDNKVQETLRLWNGCTGMEVRSKVIGDDGLPVKDEADEYVWETTTIVHEKREECSESGCIGMDNIRYENHHCDDLDWCNGTADDPCDLVSRHVNRVGLIAEEVAQVFPRAITKQGDGDESGINYEAIIVELVNTVQHLLEDRDEARDREAREILARRALEQRMVAVEAGPPG